LKEKILKPGEANCLPAHENSVLSAGKENSRRLALEIYAAILDKKGKDVVIIDISEQSSFADYFVNATALNVRMLDSLHTEIDKQIMSVAPPADSPSPGLLLQSDSASAPQAVLRGIEGKASSGWVLMDYGDVIVNLFLEEQRESYQIEKIWADGIFIDPRNGI
jgi:ribosome-associated protein